MNIITTRWKWNNKLSKRKNTKYIVLHHADANVCTAAQIDSWHKAQGWAGIGYHFFVRKDGSIYAGRPLDKVGAHVEGFNSLSVGICAEGDYSKPGAMPAAQYNAIVDLTRYVKNIYPSAAVVGHRDLYATVCPGNYYPLAMIQEELKGELTMSQYTELKDEINKLKPTYYDWTLACPEWSQKYVQKALDMGILKGDDAGRLRLTDEKIFSLVTNMRMNGIMK